MTDQPSAQSLFEVLLKRLNSQKPIRAPSLIVTLFGDALLLRGGTLWLGSLTTIVEPLGLEAGAVRTAMTRLVAEGLFERSKEGRRAFYYLSADGKALFSGAEKRIYAAQNLPWDGLLRLWLLHDAPSADDKTMLSMQGFGLINGVLAVSAHDKAPPLAGFFLESRAESDAARGIIARAFDLIALEQRYRHFIADFSALHEALRDNSDFSDLLALALRLLLVHQWRRIVLKDPRLPSALLPPDWPGLEARAIATALYLRLLQPSEHWLDHYAEGANGALPPPKSDLFQRFSSSLA